MPNWCTTSMVITGPKNELENLMDLLWEWTSKEYRKSDFGKNWLGNIVLGAGFETSENGGFKCRGAIVDLWEEPEEIDNGVYKFDIVYESAWCPVHDMWHAVLKKFAPSCKMYWYAEESGTLLYESNDINQDFYIGDYVVNYYLEESNPLCEAFVSGETCTASVLQERLGKIFGKKPLDALIDEVNHMDFGEYDYFHVEPIKFVA